MTHYVGKIIGNRVLAVCRNMKGDFIQVPHVDMMAEDGLALIALEGTPKAPLKYLSRKEVACFLQGMGIDGERLETPKEQRERYEREHKELMKDPYYAALFEEIKNRVAA